MKNKILIVCLIIALCLGIAGCSLWGIFPPETTDRSNSLRTTNSNTSDSSETTDESTPTPEPTIKVKEASIISTGDIMVHSTQLTAQYDKGTDTYDFSNNFQFVKKYFESADYAAGNMETTLSGNDGIEYEGYPAFNTPDALADAMKNAGLDLVLTANNHIYDRREHGFFRTGQVLRDKGFDVIGTRTENESDKYFIKDINGIKVGFINYTYENVRQNGKKSLNGNVLSDKVAPLVDSFDYNNIEAFYAEIEQSMADMNQKGAEFYVAYVHWGNEYKTTQNSHQESIAQKLCDLGIDVILGTHPHVIQPADVLISEDTGNKTFVVYSQGNFMSNQRVQFMDMKSGHTEDGVLIKLNIVKEGNNDVELNNIEYFPTWVNMYKIDNKRIYDVVPLPEAINNPTEFNLDKLRSGVNDAKNSYERTKEIINVNYEKINEHYKFGEGVFK